MPPTIGAAIGFITSEPIPVSQSIGTRLAKNRGDRHQLGTQALHSAFDGGRPQCPALVSGAPLAMRCSSASCRYTTMTTPVSTAMPNSAM